MGKHYGDMIELKMIQVVDDNDIHKVYFVDLNTKKIIFETIIERLKMKEALAFETGLMYGLHKAGINFLFSREKMTQEKFDALLK